MGEPLRIGIIGAGFIAEVIAQAIRDSGVAMVTGVASRRRESAAALAARHGDVRVFDTVDALVSWDGVDAIYCATPTAARESTCLAGVRAGRHLLAEKPFASLESLRAITDACRRHRVAFLDATHFVHHPRHKRLRAELHERIGAPQAIQSSFFFPGTDPRNIRLRPDQEPTGAVGDMAWYCMRAVAEFTPADAQVVDARTYLDRHPETGGVWRAAGVLRLSNGCTSTWDAGYSTGANVQDLAIQGARGMITQDDFVLDWARGFGGGDASFVPAFTQRAGPVNPRAWERVECPSDARQSVRMVQAFARLVHEGDAEARAASMAISERTQSLVDAVWRARVEAR